MGRGSYIGTTFTCAAALVGIPVSAWLYFRNESKERLAEQQEIDGDLKENYYEILRLLITTPELDSHDATLQDKKLQQQQRRVYEYLVSLFETAHMRLADEKDYVEMWNSWEDYIDEWLKLPNFKAALPQLLVGENADFVKYMEAKAGLKLPSLGNEPPRFVT